MVETYLDLDWAREYNYRQLSGNVSIDPSFIAFIAANFFWILVTSYWLYVWRLYEASRFILQFAVLRCLSIGERLRSKNEVSSAVFLDGSLVFTGFNLVFSNDYFEGYWVRPYLLFSPRVFGFGVSKLTSSWLLIKVRWMMF